MADDTNIIQTEVVGRWSDGDEGVRLLSGYGGLLPFPIEVFNPDQEPNEGYLVLSPTLARDLAALLIEAADRIDSETGEFGRDVSVESVVDHVQDDGTPVYTFEKKEEE